MLHSGTWLLVLLLWMPLSPLAPAVPAAPPQPPDTIDWAEVHALTMRGIDRFYRLDTQGAIQTFDSVARMAPGDPRGYFFRGIVHFSLYALERDRTQFDAFMRQSEYVIGVCEQLLENDEGDSHAKFYLGGAYGYRGMLWQTEGSIIRAVADGRKGYAYLEEAVEERPELYDAHMGFGLFRYLVAKAPRSFHWMIRLLGITPDMEGGLRMLKTAAERGLYTRNEARLYLAQFLFSEDRHDEAFDYLNQLCAEYPENTLFLILRASWLQRTGRPDEALRDALRAVEQNGRRPLRYVADIAYSTLGGMYFARNEFGEARKYYALYVDSLINRNRIWNWTWYRIGASHELTGDRATALAMYARTNLSDDVTRPMDAYYYRRAQYNLRHPIGHAEGAIIRGGNAYNTKAYDEALRHYTDALGAAGDNVELRSRALLGIMQALFELKRYQEVVQTGEQLVRLQPEEELWVIPHGYHKLGQAHARLGNATAALAALDAVEEFDDYDFQDRLESRVDDERKALTER